MISLSIQAPSRGNSCRGQSLNARHLAKGGRTLEAGRWSLLLSKLLVALATLAAFSGSASAQKKLWSDRVIATTQFLQQHMWNPNTGNFIRRTDAPASQQGSDAWGITIVLDAYAYMVQQGFMKPADMKQYFQSSSALYEKSGGDRGARILARQGSQTYIGGDDDLQWIAALVHCYDVTHDRDYLNTAENAFRALIDLGFWREQTPNGGKGWAWNSSDQRPNGVSTAYGALAAARLFAATHEYVYKQWAAVSLNALRTPQVGFFARDMAVAANAALTIYDVTKQPEYLTRAESLIKQASAEADEILRGTRKGERNPTDVGDVAEALERMAAATKSSAYQNEAVKLVQFFFTDRSTDDIAAHGFASRYDTKGEPETSGAYLGVPLTAELLPEVAEMLKLSVVEYMYSR